MKTKFTFKAFLPALLLIPLLYVIILVIPSIFITKNFSTPLFPRIFIPTFLIFLFVVLFGELRTKCINITINKNDIIVKRLFGLFTKTYKISEIEGWKYSHLIGKGGTYEYLYLYKAGMKVVKMSQFYHKNYFKIKNYIQGNFKYLGYEKLSYIDEFKEIFK
ncbi:hypothetical protein [Chryseobacterium viscerum]|uniref:Bacterial Pleckstrin homology domain-containing protein n=1 Tax=Chryseobacterium viscerum TaxID=1037377 RepID=A0A5N4BRC7_9FLAO|nr:hypothetical protein [Chryseobacterium viscerum]KAB1230930.1 hypothetical protein F8D52_11085 [Chryseobacterium viscerum]